MDGEHRGQPGAPGPALTPDAPADPPHQPGLSAAERGRRTLALVIVITVLVLLFGLGVFAWMYVVAPIA